MQPKFFTRMKLFIHKYCRITNSSLSVNGKLLYQNTEELAPNDFLTSIYREEKVAYPKFFKMDNLSKTGFLAAEMLLKGTTIYGEQPKLKTAMFISNKSASLDTDEAYQKTLGEEYFPSPAVFVYTLPNILMGEIAIKHKLFGENTFFVSELFDYDSIYDYVCETFSDTDIENALVGWIDYYHNDCAAFLMLVEKENKENWIEFSTKEIVKL